jgi:hypothetical protein
MPNIVVCMCDQLRSRTWSTPLLQHGIMTLRIRLPQAVEVADEASSLESTTKDFEDEKA